MPRLQVDGVAVAEISEGMAEQLRNAAQIGIGKVREDATFQTGTREIQPRASVPTFEIKLTVDFPQRR
jgi:hypothetical protein